MGLRLYFVRGRPNTIRHLLESSFFVNLLERSDDFLCFFFVCSYGSISPTHTYRTLSCEQTKRLSAMQWNQLYGLFGAFFPPVSFHGLSSVHRAFGYYITLAMHLGDSTQRASARVLCPYTRTMSSLPFV